jgi:hypothetical protein
MLIAHALRLLGFPRIRPKPEPDRRLADIDWPELDWKFETTWAGERREISPGFELGGGDWRPIIDPETGSPREIEVVDPLYGRRLRLRLSYILRGGEIVLFAADEVSNGVWLVFVPKDVRQGKGLVGRP